MSIIYLNGPSSVGKTTLARALQQELREPFLVVGIDQLIDMMPDWINNWETTEANEGFYWERSLSDDRPEYRITKGPFAQQIGDLLFDWVLLLATRGFNLIIDDVSFGKDQVDRWRKLLADYQVVWVGLTAPEQILLERERLRGDRKIGSTRAQRNVVHEDVVYDLMINTDQSSLAQQIEMINTIMRIKRNV